MESSTTNTVDRKGQTITFYSYKGGVGRSMALVNIACLAAKENKKILLIDCDLEAPGLHQFFKTNDDAAGFVDLISDVDEWISTEANNNEEGYCRFMAERFHEYVAANVNPVIAGVKTFNNSMDQNSSFDHTVSIDLIKAGKFDKGYSEKLNKLNWIGIYKKAPAFFRTFAYCLEKEYDYIFVDARTGLADTSGICTMLMPQKLVLVFALNNQNINGVLDVASQAIEYRFSSSDYRDLQVFPLPSRIENSVNPYLPEWIEIYKNKFQTLFTEKYQLDQCNLSAYFDRSFIQYYAIHAYGENIPVLTEPTASSNFISYNYNNFYTVLKTNIPPWEFISDEDAKKNERKVNELFNAGLNFYYKGIIDKAIEQYNNVLAINPGHVDAYVEIGNSYFKNKEYDKAISYYEHAIRLDAASNNAYQGMSASKSQQGKYEEAVAFASTAIQLKADIPDYYFNRGVAWIGLGKFENAIADFDRNLALNASDSEAYVERARCAYYLMQYQNAIEDCNAAIGLNDKLANAYNIKACAYRKMKNLDEALSNNELSLKLDNNDPDFWATKAEIMAAMKNEDGFYENMSRAMELGFDIKPEITNEPELLGVYLNTPRFRELLKKYGVNIPATAEAAPPMSAINISLKKN
ncbi:MAG: tetratricopeptide repeat protein [Bacteroidetes bacterium]|nr:tetratricopeptide repeat protein [Bacteroidota bacterium]